MAQITMENVVYVQHTPAPAQILSPYFSSISTKRNASDTMSANPTALLEPFWGKRLNRMKSATREVASIAGNA